MLFADGVTIDAPWVLLTLGGAGGVIALLFRLLIASRDREYASKEREYAALLKFKDDQIHEIEVMKKIYQDVAAEAVRSAAETTNYYRHRDGKPSLVLPIAVVPEGQSPPTMKQLEAATVATMRAAMAAIKLATGQEPRVEPGENGAGPPAANPWEGKP